MDFQMGEQFLIEFNQDNQYFSEGTSDGFRIYNTDPFKLKFERSKYIYNIIIL
jgi:hypothetical protein